MDLRNAPPPSPPRVTARASAAAELLRLIGVLIDPDPSTYDVGEPRITELRGRLSGGLLEELHGVLPKHHDDKSFLVLSLLAASLPDPAGVAELTAALRADPGLAWRAILAHSAQELEEHDTADLARRLLAGDQQAIGQLEALVATTARPAGISTLLATEPESFGIRLHDLVERVDAEVWQELADEAMGPIFRDVAYRNEQLDGGADPGAVVLAASNGFELPEDAGIREVVLLPSYWLRPWLVVGSIGSDGLEVISTAVADEFIALPSEAPPPALLKLFKALSDAGRLKLLRRMTSGPISLGEAADELDVAKATAHHHLAILRQAGLVSIRGEGRATRHGLRQDPAGLAQEALARYVPDTSGRHPEP